MLKNNADYDTPDEDGDEAPSSNETTRRPPEDATQNRYENKKVLLTSSADDTSELATHSDPFNSSSSYMISERDVLEPVPASNLLIETSIANALVNDSIETYDDHRTDLPATGPTIIASSQSGVAEDMKTNQSGELGKQESPNEDLSTMENEDRHTTARVRFKGGATGAIEANPARTANEESGELWRWLYAYVERVTDRFGVVRHYIIAKPRAANEQTLDLAGDPYEFVKIDDNHVKISSCDLIDELELSGRSLEIRDIVRPPDNCAASPDSQNQQRQ